MDLFRCERQRMTLTVQGCAKLWRSARDNRPEPWEGRHACLGCPIGARNAGQSEPEIAAEALTEALRLICPGCSRVSDRIINGRHCVSCYNRRREAAAGRNAKGGKPRILGLLRTVTLAVQAGDGAPSTVALENVASRTEAMILAAKRAGGPLAFQRPLLQLQPPALEAVQA